MSETTLAEVFPSNATEAGTYHQDIFDAKSKKAHLFSSLDLEYADAVHQDAANVIFSEADERALRFKIDRRILPMVFFSFLFNRLNRSAMGNTHIIQSFNDTYGVTTNGRYTLSLSVYYIGYCLLGMPAVVLQRHIGANRFFFITISFGAITSLSFVYAKGYAALVILRFLLGVGEAGYQAGMIYYLSFWYKRHELAVRVSLTLSIALAGAVGGLLAYCLVQIETRLLAGWQLLILSEAIPTMLTAIAILLYLPAYPFTAPFLSSREKAIAQARVNKDHKPQSHGGMSGWQGFKCIVADLNAWLFTLIYASFNMGPNTIIYILPTLITNAGFSAINAQALTICPYMVSYFLNFALSRHSDHAQQRGWHIMLACLMSTLGYVILATPVAQSQLVAYSAIFLVVGGIFCLHALVMSWATNTFSPTSKRGVGTAFITSVSNCLAVLAPQIYFDPEDGFRKGHAICAGCLFLAFCTTFILHTRLVLLNKRREDAMSDSSCEIGDSKTGSDTSEIWDSDPRYKFTT